MNAGELPVSSAVAALLQEIADRLAALARDPAAQFVIDPRFLLQGRDGSRQELLSCLGSGEVQAHCDIAGATHVRETAYAGVWWLSHHGAGDELLFEQIVIARVPQLLYADAADIADAARRLRAQGARPVSGPQREPADAA